MAADAVASERVPASKLLASRENGLTASLQFGEMQGDFEKIDGGSPNP
jgi:hypothetical protein